MNMNRAQRRAAQFGGFTKNRVVHNDARITPLSVDRDIFYGEEESFWVDGRSQEAFDRHYQIWTEGVAVSQDYAFYINAQNQRVDLPRS